VSVENPLEVEELTVLTGWAEAAAEALAHAPERATAVVADARSGAGWVSTLGLAAPSRKLGDAIDSMSTAIRAASPPGGTATSEAVASALRENRPDEAELEGLVRRVLLAMIDQRGTRQALQAERREFNASGESAPTTASNVSQRTPP
jgi:hypothetical protein